MIGLLIAAILAAGATPRPGDVPPDPAAATTAARPDGRRAPPREDPDAEMLRELELLQNLELLEHYELFE